MEKKTGRETGRETRRKIRRETRRKIRRKTGGNTIRNTTTVEIKYRLGHIQGRYLAVPFCDIEFKGARLKEFEKEWGNIELKRFQVYDEKYRKNERKIKEFREEARRIEDQVKNSKPWYRLWYNQNEREMIATANGLWGQAIELERKNEVVKEKRYFSDSECYTEFVKFLKEKGFKRISKASYGKYGDATKEIWRRIG